MNRSTHWVKHPTDDKTPTDVFIFKIYYPWQFYDQWEDRTNKY